MRQPYTNLPIHDELPAPDTGAWYDYYTGGAACASAIVRVLSLGPYWVACYRGAEPNLVRYHVAPGKCAVELRRIVAALDTCAAHAVSYHKVERSIADALSLDGE